MAQISSQRMSDGWKAGVGRSGQKWLDGVMGQTDNPATKAAAASNTWVQNTTAAKSKFENSLNSVSLDYIKKQAQAVGTVGCTSGANKGSAKYTAFSQQFAPFLDSVKASLPARGSLDQNKARAIANIDAISKFSYQRRSI